MFVVAGGVVWVWLQVEKIREHKLKKERKQREKEAKDKIRRR